MKKLFILFLLMGISSAQAALFQGDSSGAFINPEGPSGMVTTGVGTNAFTWGVPLSGTAPSSLGYTGTPFDIDENIMFVFGSLNYFNGSIEAGTEADSVELSVLLDFTEPSILSQSFEFDLALINTLNTTDPNASADIVNFDNTVASNSIIFNGIDFTLEFLGFGSLFGDGFTVEDSFRVLEGSSATVDLVGQITSTPGEETPESPVTAIPEPSVITLFALGLLGLGFARRKKA